MRPYLLTGLISFLILALVEGKPNITSNGNDIINIPILTQRSFSNNCKPQRPRYFYKRQQNPNSFTVGISSATFTKIPGLSLAVHHAVPMVYKMRVQIVSQIHKQWTHSLIRFLINDGVVVADQLFPNNDKRLKTGPVLEDNIIALDLQGGGYTFSGTATYVSLPSFKMDLVLMPAGTHFIEVGARTEDPWIALHGGELSVEMTEYDPDLHIGLSNITVRNLD